MAKAPLPLPEASSVQPVFECVEAGTAARAKAATARPLPKAALVIGRLSRRSHAHGQLSQTDISNGRARPSSLASGAGERDSAPGRSRSPGPLLPPAPQTLVMFMTTVASSASGDGELGFHSIVTS
jgi:hypothetical protein